MTQCGGSGKTKAEGAERACMHSHNMSLVLMDSLAPVKAEHGGRTLIHILVSSPAVATAQTLASQLMADCYVVIPYKGL